MYSKHNIRCTLAMAALVVVASACRDDDKKNTPAPEPAVIDPQLRIETYAGGELGTVFNATASAFEQPTPATVKAGLEYEFKMGEAFFERDYTINTAPFKGLGPIYTRTSCLTCHPGYGHGGRQTRYRYNDYGNGYKIIVTDRAGEPLSSLSIVPATKALPGLKPMIDEEQVRINWIDYTDEWGNTFPDGERYSLIYPELIIPEEAIYSPLIDAHGNPIAYADLVMTLETSIGIYGTGLIDAIPDDSIRAEYIRQERHGVPLNPAIWAAGNWTAMGADGHPFRFDYALDATSTQDNFTLWKATNVVSAPFRHNFIPEAYGRKAAADPEIQANFYANFPDAPNTGNVEADIFEFLCGDNKPLELSEVQQYQLKLWARGLAVPAARNLDDEQVQLGRKLFRQIGCATCHRPSWTTGGDEQVQDPYNVLGNRPVPRYPHQTIWPYTDLVQHRLFMQNDIRTGWCRTTPLWGRGLMQICAGHSDRLHDCRARNTMEAIMWHGSPQSDARWTVDAFRKLSKQERDAVVKFIDAI